MVWRQSVPRAVLPLLKIAKAVATPAVTSADLPPDLIDECRFCASRLDMLDRLAKGGRVAEIGTQRGHFAGAILDRVRPDELHLVDVDFGATRADVLGHPKVRTHQGLSGAVLPGFEPGSFDWIYVDADHSYAGVRGDASLAARAVRPGGLLIFNDFAHADPFFGRYGVHRAVIEFATQERWPFVWFAYEPNGLYDVALRRPLHWAPATG